MKGWDNAYGQKRDIEPKDGHQKAHDRIEKVKGDNVDQHVEEKVNQDKVDEPKDKTVDDSNVGKDVHEEMKLSRAIEAPVNIEKVSKFTGEFPEDAKSKEEEIVKWNINIKKMIDNPFVAVKNEKIIIQDKKPPQDITGDKQKIPETREENENKEKNEEKHKESDEKSFEEEKTEEDSEESNLQKINDDKNKTAVDKNPDDNNIKPVKPTDGEQKKREPEEIKDPLTPIPYNSNAPKPTPSSPVKTTPMTPSVTTKHTDTVLQMDEEHRPVEGKHMMPVYLPKEHFERLAELTKEDQTIEVKFIDDPTYIDEKLQLDPVKDNAIPKTTVSKIDPIKTDQIIPTESPSVITTTTAVTIKDTVMSFLSKVAAALKCTKRDCSEAIKNINVTKRKELKEHSTPPRRVRQVMKESGKICTCQF
ncbi:unnamed protein product [Bursaphelenchus xylophilus]|uniref:(pine wood nematode) hypothetical protein n=1 Tax=Bursaphelenchus xylophilus TaxID=6326 RepID=A0A1I7SWU4_BURXY|nr:unnamed protein product [Bursaphelenchus xylophilus]CAG9099929.1 unnamed protein product [Bursaphelenchus xylophilus]